MIRTPLTDLLGISCPIIQAGMAQVGVDGKNNFVDVRING